MNNFYKAPEISTELNRKTLEALIMIYERWQNKEVANSEVKNNLDIIWTLTSGLVSRDCIDFITKFYEEIK